MSLLLKVKTGIDLGLFNLVRLIFYKLRILTGLSSVKRLYQEPISGPFFRPIEFSNQLIYLKRYKFVPFGWLSELPVNEIKWDENVLTNQSFSKMNTPWYELPDFDPNVGDIKGIWEVSRFEWSLGLARDYLLGRETCLEQLNVTINSWIAQNPPYIGPNWKCGQEASIRVIHLAFTAKLLGQVRKPELALLQFIKAHLQRIAPTISYAIAQDNNHGTSEAAALFIGGSWLVEEGDYSAVYWQKMGLKWLENRALRLIEDDGSFSQYSITYHRVMLETYVMAELWRCELKLPLFSEGLYKRLQSSTIWLYEMIQAQSGDVPNLGANDGARLLHLTNSDYRDFRPSVQLASVVFFEATAWKKNDDYDMPLLFLGIHKPEITLPAPKSFHFEKGGYIGLRNQNGVFVLFNYPNFRFRPSQCDALHIDLWLNGQNLLRDGGTFSYNAGQHYIDYYGGTKSHNTIQFDEHEQMPRLSRFLLGAWLKVKNVKFDECHLKGQAGYKDYFGCEHYREVSLNETSLVVKDHLRGFKNKAVLRWRLHPDNWQIRGQEVTNGKHSIIINCDVQIERFEIVEGKESRYYFQESSIPVLEVEVWLACKITTEYQFHL